MSQNTGLPRENPVLSPFPPGKRLESGRVHDAKVPSYNIFLSLGLICEMGRDSLTRIVGQENNLSNFRT